MTKISIIIYPYKGNVTLLKDKIKKWRQQYPTVDISVRSNTRRPLSENSHFIALYTTRANKRINIETTNEEKVLIYDDKSYMEAYKTFLRYELNKEIPDEDFICIDDENTIHLQRRIEEIANARIQYK